MFRTSFSRSALANRPQNVRNDFSLRLCAKIAFAVDANLGDIVRVSGVTACGWIIAQNAGQSIQITSLGCGYKNWNALITNWVQASAPS